MFRLYFTDGHAALTERDGAVNYGIENLEHFNTPLAVTFERGRIVHIKRESDA